MKRRTSIIINIALVICSLLAVLIVCEVVLTRHEEALLRGTHIEADDARSDLWQATEVPTVDDWPSSFTWDSEGNNLIHMRSADPVLVYEMRPNVDVGHISTNSWGFRDREFVLPKPADVCRIVAVGDSVTFGWDEHVENTYPKVLESLLNAQSDTTRRYEVYNLAVVGYNAEQEMEIVRTKALSLEPDLILIGFCMNDCVIGADAGLWWHFTRGRVRTWDFVKLRWMRFVERFRREGLVARNYRKIARLCEEHDVPLLVVVFPALWSSYPSIVYGPNDATVNLCTKLGIPVLDLFSAYAHVAPQHNGIENRVLKGVHPTRLGHKVAAEEILRFLGKHPDSFPCDACPSPNQ